MSAFKILAGKPTGKRLFGRPILEEDNIRMDLKEIGISARNWADSTEDWDYWRAVRECGIEPPGSISHVIAPWLIEPKDSIPPPQGLSNDSYLEPNQSNFSH